MAELKQAVLQLAVQGKLTRQYPDDEPAAEKKRLGIKSVKMAEIGEGERPFSRLTIQNTWEKMRDFPTYDRQNK